MGPCFQHSSTWWIDIYKEENIQIFRYDQRMSIPTFLADSQDVCCGILKLMAVLFLNILICLFSIGTKNCRGSCGKIFAFFKGMEPLKITLTIQPNIGMCLVFCLCLLSQILLTWLTMSHLHSRWFSASLAHYPKRKHRWVRWSNGFA